MLTGTTELLQENAKNDLLQGLKDLVKHIHPKGPFFMGENFGYADIALVPWWQRFHIILKHYRNFTIPESEPFSRIYDWYSACLKIPAYTNTIVDKNRLITDYLGYANNSATSDAAKKFMST